MVNLPLVASTDPPQQTTFTVNQAPFPTITITATVRWQWSWGDGASDSTSWPGRAYDGTDPRTSPGHYVSHAYSAPSPGARIGVTAVWSGSYSVAGMGSQPIDGTVQREQQPQPPRLRVRRDPHGQLQAAATPSTAEVRPTTHDE